MCCTHLPGSLGLPFFWATSFCRLEKLLLAPAACHCYWTMQAVYVYSCSPNRHPCRCRLPITWHGMPSMRARPQPSPHPAGAGWAASFAGRKRRAPGSWILDPVCWPGVGAVQWNACGANGEVERVTPGTFPTVISDQLGPTRHRLATQQHGTCGQTLTAHLWPNPHRSSCIIHPHEAGGQLSAAALCSAWATGLLLLPPPLPAWMM